HGHLLRGGVCRPVPRAQRAAKTRIAPLPGGRDRDSVPVADGLHARPRGTDETGMKFRRTLPEIRFLSGWAWPEHRWTGTCRHSSARRTASEAVKELVGR